MKLDESDKTSFTRLPNGKISAATNGDPEISLTPSSFLENQKGANKVADKLTVDKQETSSSRPSSARWKAATSAVVASNILIKLGNDKRNQSTIVRKMEGTNAYIPVLPLWLAIIFLIFNCIIPGLGTILSSLTFCCVGTTYDQNDRNQVKDKVIGIVMANFLTGVAQLFTTTFLLVGWFWSISRGITMVYLALEAREANEKTSIDTLVNNL